MCGYVVGDEIEVERERRRRTDTLIAQLSPTLQKVEADLAAAEKQIEDLRAAKKMVHAKVGKRPLVPRGKNGALTAPAIWLGRLCPTEQF